MLARFDERSSSTLDERHSKCSYCGRPIVLLPDDRRGGACFDCLPLASGFRMPCSACGTLLEASDAESGCPVCGTPIGRW